MFKSEWFLVLASTSKLIQGGGSRELFQEGAGPLETGVSKKRHRCLYREHDLHPRSVFPAGREPTGCLVRSQLGLIVPHSEAPKDW
jgi:hypothetical protein